MGKWRKWISACIASVPLAAHAQIGLGTLDQGMAGPRAQVLVLGTVHLSAMPAGFAPTALEGVLARLAAFQPDIITIETESGEECDLAARHPAKYGVNYCPATQSAAASTGFDVPAALAEIDKTLKSWPAQATPSERRRLAGLFLAANDRASAVVQWLQLPAAERRPGDGLDATLVDQLTTLAKTNNENYLLGAVLAARLGLQRVHAVDNHTGDRLDVADIKALVRDIEAAWANSSATYKARQRAEEALMKGADLLPLYRYINAPEGLRVLAELNVGNAMRFKSANAYPQIWVGGWETRNLRIVANIRESFRERPGARVLSIIGAAHKPWLDQWLGQLQGVDIVDVAKILE